MQRRLDQETATAISTKHLANITMSSKRRRSSDKLSADGDEPLAVRPKKDAQALTTSSDHYQNVGTVTHLFVKTGPGKAMAERPFLDLVAQSGIVGNAGTSQAQLVGDDVVDEVVEGAQSQSSKAGLLLGKLVSKAVGSASAVVAASARNKNSAVSGSKFVHTKADEAESQSSLATASRSPWTLSPRQVLLSSTQDLATLCLSPGELRENIVVRLNPGAGVVNFSDVLPSGCVVQVGSKNGNEGGSDDGAHQDKGPVLLRLTFGCEPCGHVLDRLKTLCRKKPSYPTVKSMDGKRGLLATVLRGGKISKNDELKVLVRGASSLASSVGRAGAETFRGSPTSESKQAAEPSSVRPPPTTSSDMILAPPLIKYERFSETPRSRFFEILSKVPKNRVVTIKQLLIYSGSPPGYARALPAILKSAFSESSGSKRGEGHVAKIDATAAKEACARLVYASRELFREDVVPSQKQTLERNGVVVRRCHELGVKPEKSEWCVEEKYLWRPTHSELFLGLDV